MARQKTEEKYNYILDYIEEAAESRITLKSKITRTVRAYQGFPAINYYLRKLQSYRGYIQQNHADQLEMFDALCREVEEEKSFAMHDAIETNTSMIMGGAGQFEFLPYDEYQDYDANLVDRLSQFAEFFYKDNKIDSLNGTMGRNMNTQGGAYYYLQHDEGSNKLRVTLIDAWRMLLDPYRFKSNRSRYIGFTQTESWSSLKDYIKKENKKGYVLKSINQVDTYLNNVKDLVNGVDRESWDFPTDILSRHVDMFWPLFREFAQESLHTKEKPDDSPADVMTYQADDVEITYLYDLTADMYFIVVNRHFIVVAKKTDLHKTFDCKSYNAEGKPVTYKKEVRLTDPFVEVPYIKTTWSTYPITPAFMLLEDFDKIVSMETVMQHNFSVMAPITFLGSSYDAEKLQAAAGISGQIVEGTMEAMGVMNKSHDMSSVLASIQRREERIKRTMRATDQFELQAMIGNRATASEVGQAGGAVSQGLNQVLANIEDGMSEVMQKAIDMWLIFSEEDTIAYPYNGRYHTISREDLLGRSIIRAKLKSVVKLEQQQQAQNALQVLGYVAQAEGVNKEYAYGVLIPIAMQSVVSRQQAEKMVLPQFKPNPAMLKLYADMKEQREKEAKEAAEGRDEIDDMEIPNDIPPEELDAMLLGLTGGMGAPGVPGAMPPGGAGVPPSGDMGIDPVTGEPATHINPETGEPMSGDPSMHEQVGAIPQGSMPPANPMAPGTIPSQAGVIANRQQGY